MKEINRVTIICVDCYSYGKAVAALQRCMEQVKAERVLFLTDIQIKVDGVEVIQIPSIRSKEEYSKFIIKELYKYFDTEFCLIVQHDGFIISGEAWQDEFYKYDYIGAPWLETDGKNVGNGGFSLRSLKLQAALGQDNLIKATDPEDAAICRTYRDYLVKEYGIKFPSDDLADTFSYELREPTCKTFGFHGAFHTIYKPTVILKRSAALGDCLILEPVLRYYAMKGYNVVLDIPQSFFELYTNHYFHIKHISEFDRGRIKPEKEIDLDLAYEVKPHQNYLKSYFEFCGITDYQLSRPQLFPYVDEKTKLFKKYCILHLDKRSEDYRNVHGVNWDAVRRYLENRGYIVLQVGKNEHEKCGHHINTQAVGFMKYVISGCDLFIGVDSAPSHIAVAYNKPSVIFFGSVCPDYIHPDLKDVKVIQGKCDKSGCWHTMGGTSGQECFYRGTDKYVQCTITDSDEIIGAINSLIVKE